MNITTKKLVRSGMIASLYTVLTLFTFPVSGGFIQFRLSEALTLLPLFYLESIPALFVGCLVSNLIAGCAVYDIILGSLVTLISAIFTAIIGKVIKKDFLRITLGGIFPVLLNAFILPLIWFLATGLMEQAYMLQVLSLLISQSLSIYLFGTMLYFAMKRLIKTEFLK